MDTKEMLDFNVRNIANELEAIANDQLYSVDGEFIIIADMDEWKNEQWTKRRDEFLAEHKDFDHELYNSMDEYIEDEIGSSDDIDEPDQVSASEYIDDRALSIENWKINRDGECIGGEILFCYGGPNVWANEDGVFGAWGGDRSDYYSSEAGGVILDYLTETLPER